MYHFKRLSVVEKRIARSSVEEKQANLTYGLVITPIYIYSHSSFKGNKQPEQDEQFTNKSEPFSMAVEKCTL